jgi:GSCFA family protein
MAKSPYGFAPDRSFWSRGVTREFEPAALMATPAKLLRRGDRVMSAGSCFAANLVPYLEKSGFHYVRTETQHPLLRVPAENFGYDNFSASYGNIYTARQLLQLLYRALNLWQPKEDAWEIDGEFIDPFRPGLRYRARSRAEFDLLTRQHLDSVRQAFEEATVLVFTLGLTEAWMSRADGAVFSACPGTVAGAFDANRHAFHNMSALEVASDLNEFIREVRKLNGLLRIILTVSPVPLVATATGGHVLPATIYSKSVLRVAAEEVVRANEDVAYFPAYEIVTGPQAPWDFFEPDRRNVSKAAVEAVMRALLANCEMIASGRQHQSASSVAQLPAVLDQERNQVLAQMIATVECEEAMIDVAPDGPVP